MKIAGKPGRPIAVLVGAALMTASALAGGGAAVAGAGRASHPAPRAAVLALSREGSISVWRLAGSGGLRAPALPGGGRNLPELGNASVLSGVFCTSPASCWAAGSYRSATTQADLNEILHWNGSAWSQVSAPSPGGTAAGDLSELFKVRCTKASDCWAVGDSKAIGGADLDQALHWDGRRWSAVPTPSPGGTANGESSQLFDVTCASSGNCWAVGLYVAGGGARAILNAALHWNGRKWAQVPAPNPGGTTNHGDTNALNSVRCTAATSCLAVGSYGTLSNMITLRNEALRWNGRKWAQVPTPNPGGTGSGDESELLGLACVSATSCWAVGDYGIISPSGQLLSQILHWNGRTWSLVTIPEPGGTSSGANQSLAGVTCSSATSCWAVGDYLPSGGDTLATLNQALHWDGTTWSLVFTPDPAGYAPGDFDTLHSVRCMSSTSCWAVGLTQKSGGPQLSEALHWNGTSWSTG